MGERKDTSDDSQARGWDLFKWKWIAEPPEGVVAVFYGILFIVFLLIAFSGAIALFQLLAPIWIGESSVTKAPGTDAGAELRGRLLVIGALLTTPFLVWRLIVSHWSARAAQEQARIAQETARNTLFTKAVEQLGIVREVTTPTMINDADGSETTSYVNKTRPNIETRLGAIYALGKLAREDLSIHWPIMETLCAYVRENAGPPLNLESAVVNLLSGGNPDGDSVESHQEFLKDTPRLRVDVQAALTVIGRRSRKQIDYETAIRTHADDRKRSKLQFDFSSGNLARSNLSELILSNSIFDFSTLTFGTFTNLELENSSFNLCDMQQVKSYCVNFTGSRFEFTQLSRSEFHGCVIQQCNFSNTTLSGCVFTSGTDLSLSLFNNIFPKGLRFEAAQLLGSRFFDCFFSYSFNSFSRSGLVDVQFESCKFDSADTDLTQDQLDTTWGDDGTIAPGGLARPTTGKWLPSGADDRERMMWRQRLDARRLELASEENELRDRLLN